MLSHNSSHIQFITYTQFQLQFHDPNITIYHTNIIQNTNKLYKNVSHNTGSTNSQTILYNHTGRITTQQTSQNKPQFNPLKIPIHVHSNSNCDKLIIYL